MLLYNMERAANAIISSGNVFAAIVWLLMFVTICFFGIVGICAIALEVIENIKNHKK